MIFWFILCRLSIAIEIVAWPLPNEEKRKQLTQMYLQTHYTGTLTGELVKDVVMEPKMIVLHWTAASTSKSTWNTFSSAYLSGRKDIQKGGALNVSAHFLVAQDGTIYQLLNENRIARHCIGLNHLSIGIENVGGGKNNPLTEAQVGANISLITHLSEQHDITHVIGHYEVKLMEGHSYFSEKDPKYRSIKPDPGTKFMLSVRKGLEVKGLEIQSPQEKKD
jgi:hypothetical protein